MQIYAVFSTLDYEHDQIVQRAKAQYTAPNVFTIPSGILVASPGETSQEVASNLGIGNDKDNFTGVVVMVNYYWGFHNKDLWEWMAARSKRNGN